MAFSLAQPAHSKIGIKKSVFIGFVTAVAGRPEALTEVACLRREHPNATHVCWTLLAGGHSGASDDGEPGGKASLPMLNVLQHQDLEQVLAVVTRYYEWYPARCWRSGACLHRRGGASVMQVEKIALVVTTTLCSTVPYALEGSMRRLLQQSGVTLGEVTHGDMVSMCFLLPLSAAPALRRKANELCHGALQWCENDAD